jgi:hypothetical protein
MVKNSIKQSAKVLSIAMLNNPHHKSVFLGNGEKQRQEIEKMFLELFNSFPGFIFLAKKNEKIIGVMRMKSCTGDAVDDPVESQENVRFYQKFGFRVVSESEIFGVRSRYMLRVRQICR